MSVSGNPPYNWTYGTDLEDDRLWSRSLCELMQALKNRAEVAGVTIANWKAYHANGNVMGYIGQSPDDNALSMEGTADETGTIDTFKATGIVDSVTQYTMTDGSQSWFANQWAGATLKIKHGVTWYFYTVVSNTATTVTVQEDLVGTNPGDEYEFEEGDIFIFWDTSESWTPNEHVGKIVQILDGATWEAFEIVSNTATAIVTTLAMIGISEGSQYRIVQESNQRFPSWRHVNIIGDMREVLEAILDAEKYRNGSQTLYTLETLLQEAVGRDDYNRSLAALQALGYCDGEDVEELQKAVDKLNRIIVWIDHDSYARSDLPTSNFNGQNLSAGNNVWESFLRISAGAPTVFYQAILAVYATAASGGTAISVNRINDETPFDEATLTWNNRPTDLTFAGSLGGSGVPGWYTRIVGNSSTFVPTKGVALKHSSYFLEMRDSEHANPPFIRFL